MSSIADMNHEYHVMKILTHHSDTDFKLKLTDEFFESESDSSVTSLSSVSTCRLEIMTRHRPVSWNVCYIRVNSWCRYGPFKHRIQAKAVWLREQINSFL